MVKHLISLPGVQENVFHFVTNLHHKALSSNAKLRLKGQLFLAHKVEYFTFFTFSTKLYKISLKPRENDKNLTRTFFKTLLVKNVM